MFLYIYAEYSNTCVGHLLQSLQWWKFHQKPKMIDRCDPRSADDLGSCLSITQKYTCPKEAQWLGREGIWPNLPPPYTDPGELLSFSRTTPSNSNSKHSMPSNQHNRWEYKVFDHTYPQYTDPRDSMSSSWHNIALSYLSSPTTVDAFNFKCSLESKQFI